MYKIRFGSTKVLCHAGNMVGDDWQTLLIPNPASRTDFLIEVKAAPFDRIRWKGTAFWEKIF